MRKSRSMPCFQRQPLCPPSRPSGVLNVSGALAASRGARWELTSEKLANAQAYEDRSVWAQHSFDIHRPLNQRLARPRPEKVWVQNEVGNKRAYQMHEAAKQDAASASYDLYRPLAHGQPPWEVHERAAYVTACCMPRIQSTERRDTQPASQRALAVLAASRSRISEGGVVGTKGLQFGSRGYMSDNN
mmetsp:Transcript_116811/g.183687  ORF Transcript_116811/g.183687 Transcript_116811/m.183687 type:complete len:188 (-) Transcript_116811:27-590(-)